MWNKKAYMAMLVATCTVLAGAPRADERLQVHGFVSQAAVHTDDNEMGGNSEDGVGLDMREMGVNLSYRPNGDWLFSGQALARWAGETDDGGLRLDYAFVDRTLISSENARVGVQLGKVKNPYGLYNMTRDVAHTRPGILMPQSVYLDRVRNFFLAAPGVSAYGNHVHGAWETSWRLNVMRPETDSEDIEYLFLLNNFPGEYEGMNSWLGQVMTEWDGGRLRLGFTFGEVKTEFSQGPGESTLKPRLLSLEWNDENWSLTGEYEQVDSEGKDYGLNYGAGGISAEDPNTVEAWYVQGTYRLTPDWRVYLRRDVFYFDKKDKSGNSATVLGIPSYLMYAKSWTVGVRHDWGPWAFSGEIHSVKGTAWLSPMDTPLAEQEKNWQMLLLQAAYRF